MLKRMYGIVILKITNKHFNIFVCVLNVSLRMLQLEKKRRIERIKHKTQQLQELILQVRSAVILL